MAKYHISRVTTPRDFPPSTTRRALGHPESTPRTCFHVQEGCVASRCERPLPEGYPSLWDGVVSGSPAGEHAIAHEDSRIWFGRLFVSSPVAPGTHEMVPPRLEQEKKQERLERERRRQQNEMKNTTYQTVSFRNEPRVACSRS